MAELLATTPVELSGGVWQEGPDDCVIPLCDNHHQHSRWKQPARRRKHEKCMLPRPAIGHFQEYGAAVRVTADTKVPVLRLIDFGIDKDASTAAIVCGLKGIAPPIFAKPDAKTRPACCIFVRFTLKRPGDTAS